MRRRRTSSGYVMCVSNVGYKASLVVRRIYRAMSDEEATKRGLMRVVDESGEDYLFPDRLFVAIDLPREATRAFGTAS